MSFAVTLTGPPFDADSEGNGFEAISILSKTSFRASPFRLRSEQHLVSYGYLRQALVPGGRRSRVLARWRMHAYKQMKEIHFHLTDNTKKSTPSMQ